MNRLLVSLALAATPLAALSDTLFSQTPSGYDGDYSDAYSTGGYPVYDGDGNVLVPGVTQADDFTLAGASTVQSITFDGGSDGTTNVDLTNFSAFEIRVLSLSDAVLYDATVPTSTLTAVDTGTSNLGSGEIYALTYALPTGLSLAAGSYLLGVGAVENDAGSDRFVWSDGATTQWHALSEPLRRQRVPGHDGRPRVRRRRRAGRARARDARRVRSRHPRPHRASSIRPPGGLAHSRLRPLPSRP